MKTLNELINKRKAGLNDISSTYIAQDLLDIIHNGMTFIDPLDSKDIQEAKEYNNECDAEIREMFEENINLKNLPF
jgi:hypothetical protein